MGVFARANADIFSCAVGNNSRAQLWMLLSLCLVASGVRDVDFWPIPNFADPSVVLLSSEPPPAPRIPPPGTPPPRLPGAGPALGGQEGVRHTKEPVDKNLVWGIIAAVAALVSVVVAVFGIRIRIAPDRRVALVDRCCPLSWRRISTAGTGQQQRMNPQFY